MCTFETIMLNGKGVSPFCALFKEDKWVDFEYSHDIITLGMFLLHQSTSNDSCMTRYGQELGPVQGVGWTIGLLARLTNQPPNDVTQSNYSFPFPLNRAFYTDFSHNNEMIAIHSTVGLFRRLAGWSSRNSNAIEMVHVRIMVNDEVQQLAFCAEADKDGLCILSNFVKSQSYARSGGDSGWQERFK